MSREYFFILYLLSYIYITSKILKRKKNTTAIFSRIDSREQKSVLKSTLFTFHKAYGKEGKYRRKKNMCVEISQETFLSLLLIFLLLFFSFSAWYFFEISKFALFQLLPVASSRHNRHTRFNLFFVCWV